MSETENTGKKKLRALMQLRSLPIEMFGSGEDRTMLKLLFLYLVSFANSDGSNITVSQRTIAENFGRSERHIRRLEAEIIALGLVEGSVGKEASKHGRTKVLNAPVVKLLARAEELKKNHDHRTCASGDVDLEPQTYASGVDEQEPRTPRSAIEELTTDIKPFTSELTPDTTDTNPGHLKHEPRTCPSGGALSQDTEKDGLNSENAAQTGKAPSLPNKEKERTEKAHLAAKLLGAGSSSLSHTPPAGDVSGTRTEDLGAELQNWLYEGHDLEEYDKFKCSNPKAWAARKRIRLRLAGLFNDKYLVPQYGVALGYKQRKALNGIFLLLQVPDEELACNGKKLSLIQRATQTLFNNYTGDTSFFGNPFVNGLIGTVEMLRNAALAEEERKRIAERLTVEGRAEVVRKLAEQSDKKEDDEDVFEGID